ncbi:MAG: deoxyribodipyrimidine photolyase [Planctomyces sp.]|nr:deoxyribodipyrimidine photolyase [Planctomyces sp.]
MEVPAVRIVKLNNQPLRADGEYVLYWMTANRRLSYNYSLQRAVEHSVTLGRPLLILEAIRSDYRWASDRIHQFVLEGMRANLKRSRDLPVTYLPYIEPSGGAGRGLVEELCRKACVIVGDDFPCFFLPAVNRYIASIIGVTFESVDSNGLLPMRSASQVFPTAYAFRRFLQKNLGPELPRLPLRNPFEGRRLPALSDVHLTPILQQWLCVSEEELENPDRILSRLPIDHQVQPAVMEGGSEAGDRRLQRFLQVQLGKYGTDRNHPDSDAASGLSPYLHFGHVSAHQVFAQLSGQEGWTTDRLADARKTKGSREGWWGMSEAAESFLDELVTWRELGFNMCYQQANYDQYESLPSWAKQTLAEHANDPRPYCYSFEELDESRTHDRVWNAAQNQLVTEGRMHNYLRMLWGKKILEWSPSPQEALDRLIELNNRYAVDGRNPNSYSGIFWVLGRYDRAWGPERPIYGKIRYMTSDSTVRKLNMTGYLRQYSKRL